MKALSIPNYAWIAYKLPVPTTEYQFHATRKWRIDYAYPEVKLAIEIEGAVWVQGRHTRGSGFVKDIEKYNAITENGWRLLRYPSGKIDFQQIKKVYDMLINEKGRTF